MAFEQQLRDARVALENGRPAVANRLYRAALAEQPNNATAHAGLGWALLEQGDTEAAITQFQSTVRAHPDHGDTYIGLGTAYRQVGQLKEAFHAYDLYLGRFPRGEKASIAAYQVRELKKQLGM